MNDQVVISLLDFVFHWDSKKITGFDEKTCTYLS